MSALEQLKKYTTIVADTGDFESEYTHLLGISKMKATVLYKGATCKNVNVCGGI